MKIHRDLKVSQPTAWFMIHRIREAWDTDGDASFRGPVEVDEIYMGGKERNKHQSNKLKGRTWSRGKKVAVVGMKDRETNRVSAEVIESTDGLTLQEFVLDQVADGAKVYTDEHRGYHGLPNHQSVKHSVGEYVDGMAHTNGIESFWSMLKRGYKGTYHRMSAKHLQRYINEFSGRHNVRSRDTLDQMAGIARGFIGKRLRYADLTNAPETCPCHRLAVTCSKRSRVGRMGSRSRPLDYLGVIETSNNFSTNCKRNNNANPAVIHPLAVLILFSTVRSRSSSLSALPSSLLSASLIQTSSPGRSGGSGGGAGLG